MKSLFQSIRSGSITKPECESRLNRFKSEKISITSMLVRRNIGKEMFTRRRNQLNFNISVLEYIIGAFDDLKLPLKIPKKPGEVKDEPCIPSNN